MFKKTYGLVYRKGRWFTKNYGREIKKGGMIGLRARVTAWARNMRGDYRIIETKKIVPRPGPKEDYEPISRDVEGLNTMEQPRKDLIIPVMMGDPLIKVSLEETEK